ncbi:MAG: Ig-like domain-containing protein [Candidatus Obscuribacterales bacterium]
MSAPRVDEISRQIKRLLVVFLACTLCMPWSVLILSLQSVLADELPGKDSTSLKSQRESEKEPTEILELQEQKASIDHVNSAPGAHAIPLSASRLRELASSLPPFVTNSVVPKKFEVSSFTRKAPPTNGVIELEFPPKNSRSGLPSRDLQAEPPLHISAATPQGSVDTVEQCTIVFDQPMVPITTTGASDPIVPVKLTPTPPGHWRWLTTNTLSFQPSDARGFPRATTYTLEVPPGVKSQFGSQLENAYRSSFSTPAPRLKTLVTEKSDVDFSLAGPLRPVIVLYFDQPVDPQSVVQHLRGSVGKLIYSFKLVHAEDFARDAALKQQIDTFYFEKSVVLVQPQSDFPKNAKVTIVGEPGIASAEGPNTSQTRFSEQISTYGPLRISKRSVETLAEQQGYINFSNPLDVKSFHSAMVSVSPSVKDFHAELVVSSIVPSHAESIVFSGKTSPGKKYRITLSPQLTDIYGQHLDGPKSITNFVLTRKQITREKTTVNLSSPQLLVPRNTFHAMVLVDHPSLKIWSLNFRKIRVYLYEAKPEDWQSFEPARNRLLNRTDSIKDCFSVFTPVSTTDISLKCNPEIWEDTYKFTKPCSRIDIRKELKAVPFSVFDL